MTNVSQHLEEVQVPVHLHPRHAECLQSVLDATMMTESNDNHEKCGLQMKFELTVRIICLTIAIGSLRRA